MLCTKSFDSVTLNLYSKNKQRKFDSPSSNSHIRLFDHHCVETRYEEFMWSKAMSGLTFRIYPLWQ